MFQVSTDAGSRPWTLSRDLDAGQGSALPCCAYIQSVCLPVYSTWRDSTSKTRQLTCRKGLPLPPKTDTRLPSASPPPATCASSSSSTATTPCSPLLPSRLSLSLSLSQPTLPTTNCLLYHHHNNSPALPLSPCARLLRRCQRTLILSPPAPRCSYSLFHSHATPSGWTPDTTFTTTQHQPYPHSLDAHSPFTTIAHHTNILAPTSHALIRPLHSEPAATLNHHNNT
jgi:hypothetical protein